MWGLFQDFLLCHELPLPSLEVVTVNVLLSFSLRYLHPSILLSQGISEVQSLQLRHRKLSTGALETESTKPHNVRTSRSPLTIMDNSPLSRLAAETRNHIYRLGLAQMKPVTFVVGSEQITAVGHAFALVQTCKAIRDECSQKFFALNTIYIRRASDINIQHANAWLLKTLCRKVSLPNAAAICNVVIDLEISELEHRRMCYKTEKFLQRSILKSVMTARQYPHVHLQMVMTFWEDSMVIVDYQDLQHTLRASITDDLVAHARLPRRLIRAALFLVRHALGGCYDILYISKNMDAKIPITMELEERE